MRKAFRTHQVLGFAALCGAVLLITAGAVAVGSALGRAGGPEGSGISVSGEATVTVTPDRADLTLGLEAQAVTAQAAQRKNTETMEKVLAALEAAGVERKDIRTAGYTLMPLRRWDGKTNREIREGYRSTNLVTVTTEKLDQVGKLADLAVAAGANQVQEIAFTVADRGKGREEALGQAVARARERAGRMARAAGVRLGKVKTMSETTDETRPVYGLGKLAAGFDAASRSEAGVPVEPGRLRFTTRVQVTFAIR